MYIYAAPVLIAHVGLAVAAACVALLKRRGFERWLKLGLIIPVVPFLVVIFLPAATRHKPPPNQAARASRLD